MHISNHGVRPAATSTTGREPKSAKSAYEHALNYLASKRLQLDFLAVDSIHTNDQFTFHLDRDVQGSWHLEAVLDLPCWTLSAMSCSSDPFHVIDRVIEQLQRQLLQHTGSYRQLLDCQSAVNSPVVIQGTNYQVAV